MSSSDIPSSHVIKQAQSKLTFIWHQIEYLLLATHDPEGEPLDLPSPKMTGSYLMELINSIEIAVSKLDKNYRKALNDPPQLDRLSELASANRLLREQLKHSKTIKECLESEVKYMTRENALMNDELTQLTVRFAMNGYNSSNSKEASCKDTNNNKDEAPVPKETFGDKSTTSKEVKTKDTEVFYQNPHRSSFQHSDSNTSDLDESRHHPHHDPIEREGKNKVNHQSGSGGGVEEEKNINRKWESVFNPIMECAEGRVIEIEELRVKLRNYEKELVALEQTVSSVDSQKIQLMTDLEMLVEQQKVLLREKDRYESMLQWILKEKECSIDDRDFMGNLHDLLERLFEKVHYICINGLDGNNNTSSSFDPRGCLHCKDYFLEGAVQAVQEQNGILRIHIANLRDELAAAKAISQERTKEAGKVREEASEEVGRLRSELKEKDEVMARRSLEEEMRYKTLQELHDSVARAKEALEQSIQEKDKEMSELKSKLGELQKDNNDQQKKIQELQTTNGKLVQEIEDLQHSMKKLSAIISSLRSNFKEQKAEWSERVKTVTESASQSKEQCRWLQSQIDHMNSQLDDAHERIKAHENDKAQLAQQVILADEERRIVERKLNELRSALQGDSYLREALIERNEALQIEISRLQKNSLMGSVLGGDFGGEPNTVLFSDNNAGSRDKARKSTPRHPSHPPQRKPNEILRTAVSLHTGTGNSSP